MKKIWFSLVSGWLLALATTNVYAEAGFSEVNNALFDSAHFKNIKQPGTLHYVFKRHTFTGKDRKDTVDLVLTHLRNDGRADSHVDFFTGKYRRPFQDRDNQQGNSVFVYYLEYDIHEMQKLTGGDWHYFQRKIRWAFAAGGEKRHIMIDYKGKKVPATQYIIQPYANDPRNSRYKLYAYKYYMFTLSDAIPGEIYQVRTVVPNGTTWKKGKPALVDESITFTGFDPKAK